MPKEAKEKNIALRHLRAHLQLSQEKFAEQLGVSNQTYCKWESKKHFTLGGVTGNTRCSSCARCVFD